MNTSVVAWSNTMSHELLIMIIFDQLVGSVPTLVAHILDFLCLI